MLVVLPTVSSVVIVESGRWPAHQVSLRTRSKFGLCPSPRGCHRPKKPSQNRGTCLPSFETLVCDSQSDIFEP